MTLKRKGHDSRLSAIVYVEVHWRDKKLDALMLFKRSELRALAKEAGVRCGRNKTDTAKNLIESKWLVVYSYHTTTAELYMP